MIRLLLVPSNTTTMISMDRNELINHVGINLVADSEVVVLYNDKEYRCIKDKITGGDTLAMFGIEGLAEWIEVLNNEVNS